MIDRIRVSELFDRLDHHPQMLALFTGEDKFSEGARDQTEAWIKEDHPTFACVEVRLTQEDCVVVQVIKVPQYRFYVGGSEKKSFTGTMSKEQLSQWIQT